MIKIICLLLLASSCGQISDVTVDSLSSGPETSYYANKLQNNSDLKKTLFEIISSKHIRGNNGAPDLLVLECPENTPNCFGQQTFRYSVARELLFQVIDLKFDGETPFLFDIYCHQQFTEGVSETTVPDNTTVNCEHAWPQSRFSHQFWKSIQKSDLHHLFVTSARANAKRSSLLFGEVTKGKPVCATSRQGKVNGVYYFEPPDEHKGDLARALFYFSVRYQLEIDDNEESFLRKWHWQDPVTSEERERHQLIFSLQKNRNPFIDFPHFVDLIEDF